MKACLKKQIERNMRELLRIGEVVALEDRGSGTQVGTVRITRVTREAVEGIMEGRSFGWEGRQGRFRVPQMTQHGGDLRLGLGTLIPREA
jgi:hypothetical protein